MPRNLQPLILGALIDHASNFLPEEWIQTDPDSRHVVINLRDDLRDLISEIDLDILAQHLADIINKANPT